MKQTTFILAAVFILVLPVISFGQDEESAEEETVKEEPVENEHSSADGKIVFASTRRGPHSVFIMNADGSGQKYLTLGFEPDISPDGSKITFSCGTEEEPYAEIWV